MNLTRIEMELLRVQPVFHGDVILVRRFPF